MGVQQVEVVSEDMVVVRWDVALDKNRVGYVVYYGTEKDIAAATRDHLDPREGAGYADGVGPTVYAHEATIYDLTPGTRYYFCVRAIDSHGNEDTNENWVSAVPLGQVVIEIDGDMSDWDVVPVAHTDADDADDSSGPDWREIRIANDDEFLYIRYKSANPFNLDGSPGFGFSRTLVMIDTDSDPSTGYVFGSLGSELLLAGPSLYAQSQGVFNDGFLESIDHSVETAVTDVELAIPMSRIGSADRIRLTFFNDETFDAAPDAGFIDYAIKR